MQKYHKEAQNNHTINGFNPSRKKCKKNNLREKTITQKCKSTTKTCQTST